MNAKHARLAPSASSRWMKCAGSINLSKKVPEPPSGDAAKEGTAAHKLGERCLQLEMVDSSQFLGETIPVENSVYTVDDEMCEAIDMYLDTCNELTSKKTKMMVEAKFSLEWLHPNMFGSNDCCVYNPSSKKLSVIDLKYGKGIVVEPEWNPQLMMYALGAMYTFWKDQTKDKAASPLKLIESIELVIVQPRAYHADGFVRRWDISSKDLLFWALNVLRPLAQETESDDAGFKAGEHCRFCPAIPICPEHAANAALVAKTDFNNPVLPSPELMGPMDIVKVLDVADTFSSWGKSVKAYAEQLMKDGTQLPGYKLVKAKSNRKWVDGPAPALRLQAALGDNAYNKKILSPAQAEKALKAAKVSPEATLAGLIEKPDKGLSMAPVSDKRKEVLPLAVSEFLEDADFLQ